MLYKQHYEVLHIDLLCLRGIVRFCTIITKASFFFSVSNKTVTANIKKKKTQFM